MQNEPKTPAQQQSDQPGYFESLKSKADGVTSQLSAASLMALFFNTPGWLSFVNSNNYVNPCDEPLATGSRFISNLRTYYVNYGLVVLFFLVIWVLTSPLLLLCIVIASLVAGYIRYKLEMWSGKISCT